MRLLAFALLSATAALAACGPADTANQTAAATAAPAILATPEGKDVNSYANPLEARVTHVALDLAADFDRHVLSGTATLDIAAAKDAQKIVLDDNGLVLKSITDAQGKTLSYQVGARDPVHGAPLTIQLDGAQRIVITYETAPDAKAVQWMAPEQTLGKKKPYLFTQGEAILNRTWIPTQDSPGIRQTWDARITVPEGLTAVMSGASQSTLGEIAPGSRRTFSFKMDKPVAPYLIALAIGDLRFEAITDTMGVWSEPGMVEKAAAEFADLGKFMDAAEDLYGPYRWGRYDVLVLPPSFPYGGMENPTLTFATPTIIAGDKSLVSVIAHELAHSWSGNLVTNATWDDFWLNEGFTTYAENRIIEKVYGPERAAMEADLLWTDLEEAVKDAGGPESKLTQLHLNLTPDMDPDTATGQIAYDKGATFLRTIERAVGREKWDAYLKAYFDRHAFQPQTSAGFLADLRANLFKGDEPTAQKIGLDRWVYQPGIPANAVHVKSTAFVPIDKAAAAFAKSGDIAAAPRNVSTQEMLRFINQLPRSIDNAKLAKLDAAFHWSTTGNSEIRFAWLELAIATHYPQAETSAADFLTSQGRRKFVAPLFQELMDQPGWGPAAAQRIYAQARPGYHPLTVGTVDKIVGWKGRETAK
ncbi:MAG TPA: M1 family metallopeptidase [Sphingomonas sp.]|nr:M1 family metallopeptidase [Sphingomonas sp.]